jgi:hypothetical protein
MKEMNKLNLCEKFENEKETKTYRRYDEIHKFDWFVGYNENNNKSLVLVIIGEFTKFESTKIINVRLEKRIDNKLSLSFNLIDNNYSDIFYKFCEDMIENTRNIDNDNIIKFLNMRWNMWRIAFKNSSNKILNENEIKGLIGELIFLNEYMIKKYGIERSIRSWQGPLNFHKDYEISENWYEIKAISNNSLTVNISSVEQLESNFKGELDIVILEQANELVNECVSLNKLISIINNKIDNIDVKRIFWNKLDNIGYLYDEEYDKYNYRVIDINRYRVEDDTFPRILRKELKKGIINVSYEVALNDIDSYLIKE